MTGSINRGAPFWLDPRDESGAFPHPTLALTEPNGLLAIGGNLAPRRLLAAYRLGIFPWYSTGQPVLWWTPNPRAVLFPGELHVPRSLAKRLRRGDYQVTADTAFAAVVDACAEPRSDQDGTWITGEMQAAYCELYRRGYAHSVESWYDGELVGGLYGVALGGVFFGESMFTRRSDASKVAFVRLVRQLAAWGFGLIDCQMYSHHLARFGAVEIPRARFMALLDRHCERPELAPGTWQLAPVA